MDIKDFKTWFAGFSAVVGTNGLTPQQFTALKQAVDELGSYPETKAEANSGPGPVPAASPVPFPLSKEEIQKILEGLKTPYDTVKRSPGYDRLDPFESYPPKYWLGDERQSHFPPGTILFSKFH